MVNYFFRMAVLGFLVSVGCVSWAGRSTFDDLRHPGYRAVRHTFAEHFQLRNLAWPAAGDLAWSALDDLDVVILDLRSRTLPAPASAKSVRLAMQTWLDAGGRLLLLGYAPQWSAVLGLEKSPPDLVYLYRYGITDQAISGRYTWGITPAKDQLHHAAFSGLTPIRAGERRFLLGGGAPLDLELAVWKKPGRGTCLATMFRNREGQQRDLGREVIRLWHYGKGWILAIGAGLHPGDGTGAGENSRKLLHNVIKFITADRPQPRLGWLLGRDPAMATDDWVLPPRVEASLPWWQHSFPRPPAITHWGARSRITGWSGTDKVITPKEMIHLACEKPWIAGADVVEVDPWNPQKGYPFPWPSGDPLAPPRGYLGSASATGWSTYSLGLVGQAGHRLGMLVQPWLPVPPVTNWSGPNGVAALQLATRRLCRDLCDRRLNGSEMALDGLGIEFWPPDGKAGLQGTLWAYHPGAFLHQAASPHCLTPSTTRVVNGRFGRISGIEAGGLARGWRWDNHAPLYLGAIADCRMKMSIGPDPGRTLAGRGAYPDWLLAQVNDFARERQGEETMLLWLGKESSRLTPAAEHFVEALSAWPLRGAFAVELTATGKDGWREQARNWVPDAQSGFGASDERSCAQTLIQNAHLRLYGTGRALIFDPQGLAYFPRKTEKITAAQVISGAFFRTTIRASRVNTDEVKAWRVSRSASTRPFGGSGNWQEQAVVKFSPSMIGPMPARLSRSAENKWPRELRLITDPSPGLLHFKLRGRAQGGGGMVRLAVNGKIQAFAAFARPGDQVDMAVEIPHPRVGLMNLDLTLESGADLVLSSLSLEWKRDLAVTTRINEPGGPRAEIVETLGSTYLEEERRVIMHSGVSALVISVHMGRVDPNCRVDREIHLDGYDLLLRGQAQTRQAAAHGWEKGRRFPEGPWVLRDTRGILPDLAVVPLVSTAHQRMTWRPGMGLFIEDHPQSGDSFSLGFFLPRGEVNGPARHELGNLLGEFLNPPVLRFGGAAVAEVKPVSSFPWTRVIELTDPPNTPLLVREGGWWLTRQAVRSCAKKRKTAYLALHLLPGQAGRIRRGRQRRTLGGAGWEVGLLQPPELIGGWRPGRGSARLLALGTKEEGRVLTAQVLTCGPYVFAPSVAREKKISAPTLNGKPWSYYDGREIYLPRRKGGFTLTETQRDLPAPHLATTAARVEMCTWREDIGLLEFTVDHPKWFAGDLPSGAPYHFLVRPQGRHVMSIEGAELVPERELAIPTTLAVPAQAAGIVLRGKTGKVRIWFKLEAP